MKNKIRLIKVAIFVFGMVVGFYGFYQNPLSNQTISHANAAKATAYSPAGQTKIYLGAAPIRVTFERSSWTANITEVRKWLSTTQNNGSSSLSVDPSGFVNMIASQVNVSATSDREGRSVDTGNLTDKIKDALDSGRANTTIALVTTVTPKISGDAQGGRHNGRYIEVNVSEQALYAFDNNNLVNRYLVSTGRRGFDTPTGEFHIYGKNRSAKMSGPGYYLPHVPYISWFHGDYSIHGTYWHHNFGHRMSHGCVNMATPDAEWIFGWADIGTPVFVHN